MNVLNRVRLKRGLHWRKQHPTLKDYQKEFRLCLLMTALVMSLYATASSLEYQDKLAQEQELKEAYQQVVLNCANQAVNGGNTAVILGKEMFGIDCTKLSGDAYKNVRKI